MQLSEFDPFLLLDDFSVSAPAGFPDHPHRGFETVTYMLSGSFKHQDFLGNSGVISTGDIQWMTAGRGIVHCEMPEGKTEGHGLQLWINLKKDQKLIEPKYQDASDKDLPVVEKEGVRVKIIAGESMGVKSKILTRTPTIYLDFTLQPGSKFDQPISKGWSTFAYILEGIVTFGPDNEQKDIAQYYTATFGDGDVVKFANKVRVYVYSILFYLFSLIHNPFKFINNTISSPIGISNSKIRSYKWKAYWRASLSTRLVSNNQIKGNMK